MKYLTTIALLSLTLLASSCTANTRAKQLGGTTKVDLPAGTKFVTASWKGDDLWYSTRPARPGETPETVTMKESSSWGILEGTVLFVEK